jgi:hypothetical protein
MYTALLGCLRPRAWMECASLCSYLSSRSSKTLTESRFPERRLDRGAISFFASRPGRENLNSAAVAGLRMWESR